ncbi:phospholipid carrier-dependent glycosyltransferase [Candidatus Peregrinibacteria bacterium]|jgi:4-amino-4-deoxy-L-arabinose transferase-like glycosyltransferase|nr:phospholipid carrier-dependent glycosyltransferase [Candidatus Peregrinibacteria bacterium]MBT3598740.1 phospholipid carrier-dependent glycosyltransferase [Candidatus Peregrinibacteria bacterium]MBT6731250.1 phospholipid carrier-dependent glycosyltransferase [Candidatus Peregrinibacteria bacterium]MBT7008828.1 phospholipid carrier-dependent glycosyltransferase [Candidatus Peregrinibacteria bacterium]MBT7344571.1 phospholipid carrier-dependent glycosyltransferase [Candidatus Peregrinibacteria
MNKFIKNWWPEMIITIFAGFFFLRELDTFPAAWTDDSLFMIVSREIAAGRGYLLPILGNEWSFPYILAVGPTLLLPVALFIKVFGFSVEAARIPMVLYMILATITFYLLSKKISNKNSARWSALLLVTLSAFVNTGKVVMGEIPAMFWLLLGLLLLLKREKSWKRDAVIGLCLGLSVVTKLTMGLIYPAIGVAWIAALLSKKYKKTLSLTRIGIVALLVYIPLRITEMSQATGLSGDFEFMFSSNSGGINILHGHPEILLRPQFLYYQILLLFGAIGLLSIRKNLNKTIAIIVSTLIVGFTLYFLSSFGWYRHLLPAHILLIPFAVIGIQRIGQRFHKIISILILLFFISGQFWWQITYKGSSRDTRGAQAAIYLEENYRDVPMIVQQAEVFVRLQENPNWLFLTNPILTKRLPKNFTTPTAAQQCMYWFIALDNQGKQEYKDRITDTVVNKYSIVSPPKNCT